MFPVFPNPVTCHLPPVTRWRKIPPCLQRGAALRGLPGLKRVKCLCSACHVVKLYGACRVTAWRKLYAVLREATRNSTFPRPAAVTASTARLTPRFPNQKIWTDPCNGSNQRTIKMARPKPFTAEEIHIARVKFQLLIHQCNGQAYEDLFTSVLQRRYSGFKPVKPQGTFGDRKNDGYDASSGRYYQVYAPENSDSKIGEAIEKAQRDFAGLKKFWEPIASIKEFRFVFNDKFKGPYPEIEKALSEMKAVYKLGACECFLAKHLMDEFCHLDPQQIMDIVGYVPNPKKIRDLDFSIFADIIRHVMANPIALNTAALLRVPDFDQKIQFNNLSPAVGALLTAGSFQSGVVETFFQKNGRISKTQVRDKLADLYASYRGKSLLAKPPDGCKGGDGIFFALLQTIVPRKQAEAQDAAIVLMAYFFESCDIYEDPALV